MQWVTAKGFVSDSLEVRPDTFGGYGVFTTQAIMKGDEILRIPQQLVMNRISIFKTLRGSEEPEMERLLTAIMDLDERSNRTNNDAHLISFITLYQLTFPDRLDYQPWIGT